MCINKGKILLGDSLFSIYDTLLPVKVALAVGKNHKALLMMMRPFAPSTATTSEATASGATTSGSQSKNSPSYLKLILCCILPSSCPFTTFHPHRIKNIEVKRISYWSALVGWSGQSKKSCIHFNLFYLKFWPNLTYRGAYFEFVPLL